MVMYNDALRLQKIRKLLNEFDYRQARKELDDYMKQYSTDYVAEYYNVKLLLSENKVNKAEKEMAKLLGYIEQNEKVKKDYMYVTYVYILIEQEKYDLALKYFRKIKFANLNDYDENDIYKLRGVYLFLLKKDNIKPTTFSNQYYLNQQIEYNRCRALEHILDRHVFSTGFNIPDTQVISIFNELENIIPSSIKYPHYDGVDRYIFSYNDDGVSSLLEVLTIKHSNQIITMYPVMEAVNLEYVNTFLVQKQRCNNVKSRSSQIDKFNKKYNIRG